MNVMKYNSYEDLEKRYNRNRRTIWCWWAKDKSLEKPKRTGKVFLGWTDEQLTRFENQEAES